jgi:general secretion pathway protein G
MTARKQRALRRAGFTLMEVLVVVAILVVLAGTGGVVYMKYLDDAKKDIAKMNVQTIDDAVQSYKIRNGDYPTDLNVLTQPGQDGGAAVLEAKHLLDPWGRPIVYEPQNLHPSTHKPHVYSNGPNPGNAAGKISNWGPGQ